MSKLSEQCLKTIDGLSNHMKIPICKLLSLVLDIPSIFDITDVDLKIKLMEYEGLLSFDESLYEDSEEEEY